MSFLAWTFALGGLAIAFPILFHLIRPTPRGSQKFSSLMFLRQSAPRISKRSRIDHWLLLVMRALIVLLLAVAFMRPFVRTGGEIFVGDMPGNRVAILVDRSASMKRGDLWQQAKDEVNATLDGLSPGDDVALFAFDRQLITLTRFSEDAVFDLESRKQMVREQFAMLTTSWFRTDLGNALASVSDFVSELDDSRRSETGLQIVLISDLQQGSDLSGLQACVWPEDVRVDIRSLSAGNSGNATVRVLPDESTNADDSGQRVRLVNSADSDTEAFQVIWQDQKGNQDGDARTGFYVPPGTSQVLRVPASRSLIADCLVLVGDDCPFDNQFFVTPQSRQNISIAFFGNDKPDDARGSLYFLTRVIPETKSRIVNVEQYSPDVSEPWKDGLTPRLIVVTDAVAPEVQDRLLKFVQDGGLVLAVVTDDATLGSLKKLLPNVFHSGNTGAKEDYAMFASIDFTHPLFRPLSGPRFNDFTNIRFWNHLPVSIDEDAENSQVIARFDDDSVAIWQHRFGKGVVVGLSSSWRPSDSQLALSTKFVPLITSLLNMTEHNQTVTDSYFTGDSIQLQATEFAWHVKRPDGKRVEIQDANETSKLFDLPGVYEFTSGDLNFRVAVNLDPAESRTTAMDSASLESYDVRIGTQPSRMELAGSLQKLQDTQLENRQRIWKWLLFAAICLLILETLVAGKRQTQNVIPEAAA